MIELYFGLPRCGKTTLIASLALRASSGKRINGKRYKKVYCNVHLEGMPSNVYYIKNEWIGKYDMSDSLLLIDEGTIAFGSREWKSFGSQYRDLFLLHGHYRMDIKLFTQKWDGIDVIIRSITDRVYYVKKSVLFPFMSYYYRIPYGIIIPDRKTNKHVNGQTLGEIIQGYCKPGFFERLFCHKLYRPKYYKYFDSYEAPRLPPVPSFIASRSPSGSTLSTH